MSPINLAIVGLRLLAIYCFVQAIPLFAAFDLFIAITHPNELGFSKSSAAILATALPGGSLLILSVLLFIFSRPLARRLASSLSTEAKESLCTFEQLQALAFAVAGILILATALPGLGRALQSLFVLYAYHKQGAVNSADRVYSSWLYSIGVLAQLVVGLLLLLNPTGFRNAWRWLRTAGT